MPYRGKPSESCLHCRLRKLHCDLNKAGCSQCRRAKVICTGYRDTTALRINDETAIIQAKFEGGRSVDLPKPVNVSICQQAKDLFFYNYVVGRSRPLDFLRPFYVGSTKDGDHLLRSIDAVSLAYLNFQKRTASAAQEARQHYVTALKLMRASLRDRQAAVKDPTILSVLLLDMYEKISNNDGEDESAWAAHINGALALVKLRGNAQYHDPVGQRILIRLSTNMIINCAVGLRPIPLQLVRLRHTIETHFPRSSDPKWQQTSVMLDYIRLQQALRDGHLSSLEVINGACDLDSRFFALSKDVEPQWRYRVKQVTEKSDHHYENYHHHYESEEAARMWNVLRLTRILLNELILSHSEGRSEGYQDRARQIIGSMAREICATVPQFIEGGTCYAENPEDRLETTMQTHMPPPLTHQLPCYRLIYPLYVAGQSGHVSAGIKAWIVGRIRFMADYHGIEKAAEIVSILEMPESWDPWRIHATLGSYAFVC